MLSATLLDGLLGDDEIAGFFTDAAEIAALARVEAALSAAEAEAGLIPAEATRAIATACENFSPDIARLRAGVLRDGVIIPDFVAQLRAAVGPEFGRCAHKGATSQDIIDTALVLRLAAIADIFRARLSALIADLHGLDERFGAVPLMARTRMQRALPIKGADKLPNWLLPLERHLDRLEELRPRLLLVQLGGPAGDRADFGDKGEAVAASMAKKLGLGTAPQWHTQRDGIAEFGSFLSLVTGSLGKFGQDIALMAQNEVGEARLGGGGGSSSMPHKSNPVRAEILVTLARFNAGLAGTLHQGLVHENERSGAAWTLEWMILPQMIVATGAALLHARAICAALELVGEKA